MNPVQKRRAVELAMELEDDLLAIHLATGEVAWKSDDEPNEIRRACKQWRAARFSDARWMPPWPEGRPPLGVRWDGPFLSFSGYAWAARHYVEAAECAGLCVQARHLVVDEKYSATLTPSQHIAWKRRHHQPINPDIYLATSVPTTPAGINHYARLRKLNPGFNRSIGFTTFETDRLPPAWPEAMRAMDEIWVPSEFNRRIFEEATGGNPPIRVLPHAIDPALYDDLPPHPSIPRDRFVFLATFELSPRKGWDLLLRAWTRAFSVHDPVLLHLHTFSRGDGNPEQIIQNELQKAKLAQPHAPVQVSHHSVSDAEMRSLYASCHAFVLPSRGEGWGIPFMEAMCCGKPTIGPAEGGQSDFMNSENAWLVPGQWEPIASRTMEEFGLPAAYFAGHRWFCCREDALVDQLREVFRGGAEVERKAARGREEIRRRFSIPAVGRQLRRLLENPSPRPCQNARSTPSPKGT